MHAIYIYQRRHLFFTSATVQRGNEQSGRDEVRKDLLLPYHECSAKCMNTFPQMFHNEIQFELEHS